MSLKFVVFTAIALAIPFLQSALGAGPVSGPVSRPVSGCAMECGANEECAPCGENGCNTYSCQNKDGKGIACSLICSKPTCVCKPNYHRATPGAPCTPLKCPPAQETCGGSQCAANEVCRPCGPDGCNTYSCKNKDGAGLACAAVCSGEPTCMCKPNYHRATPDAPCTPLKCPIITPPPSCNTVKCGANARCTTCEPNDCQKYSCKNPDGAGCMSTMMCELTAPKCVCIENHHRETPNGPCVPLKCGTTNPPQQPNIISFLSQLISKILSLIRF